MAKKAITISVFSVFVLAAVIVLREPTTLVPTAHAQSTQELSTAALPTAPANWVVWNVNQSGKATITRAAGGSGVKHVATCISAKLAWNGNTGQEELFLRDGPAGTGTVLMGWLLTTPTGGTEQVELCGLNVVGSANTPMTLEFFSGSTQLSESVNLVGYDAM